jgi:ferric-dicitrate binding protein FerR (iron transport regulator)
MIKRNNSLVYLNPGQQAIVQPDQENITVNYHPDLDETIAWKNGLFIFNNAPLEYIMRQIERWYNVEVIYQGNIQQDTFNGNISRNTNLSEVLKVLEYSNIRFRVEGNSITVLPPVAK